MYNQSVSIIIPVYNGSKTICRCLTSVFQSVNPNFECIVIDDSSTDNTLEMIEQFNVKMIKLKKQQGAAHARNIGSEMAKGKILLFIDSDVTVYPDCIDKVIAAFNANPDVSALFGSYDEYPDCTNTLSQYKNLFHRYIHQTSNSEASTFWTACGAVYKKTFDEIGKFNDNCRMMEDVELGYRLKKNGYKILLVKDLLVKHLKYYTFTSLIKSDFFDRAIPWTILILNNKKFVSDLNLKFSHKLSALILIIIAFLVVFSFLSVKLVIVIVLLLVSYFGLNYEFYQYFTEKKGIIFTLKIVPFHILYYYYSTLGYAIGSIKYYFIKKAKN